MELFFLIKTVSHDKDYNINFVKNLHKYCSLSYTHLPCFSSRLGLKYSLEIKAF